MEKDKRIAVLIDAENISADYIKSIFDELANHGIPTYKRIYGDFTTPQLGPWKNVLLDNSIAPIQQFRYTTGKNASDSALIIDAMDILYSGNVDGFCIVSSDSDFTKLASRLREAGMYVIGMGEQKTPPPFIAACEKFKYLDVIARSSRATNEKKIPAKKEKELIQEIKKIINENSDEDNWISLSVVGSLLNKRFSDFDSRNFGFAKLSNLLNSFEMFEVKLRNNNPYLSIKK